MPRCSSVVAFTFTFASSVLKAAAKAAKEGPKVDTDDAAEPAGPVPPPSEAERGQLLRALASDAIRAARVEAKSTANGVGLVRLMGRHSGFIACYSVLAKDDAAFVLVEVRGDTRLLALKDGKFVVLRVPYPMGFYAKWLDGRIDDPKAGWKGRGLWASVSTRTNSPTESRTASQPTVWSAMNRSSVRPSRTITCSMPL